MGAQEQTALRWETCGSRPSPTLYLPLAVSVVATSILLAFDHRLLALLPVAALMGWTQIGGRCGTAHVNTLWMLWARSHRKGGVASVTYWFWGMVSSTLVGSLVGELGHLLGMHWSDFGLSLIFCAGVVMLCREVGWLRFRLAQWDCQTNRNWAYDFGAVKAAAMWGFHIGLGFATVITYGGFWVLVGVMLASGSPTYGAVVMVAYWIGRCLPLWVVAPFIKMRLKASVEYDVFRPLHACAIGLLNIVLLALIIKQ